MYTGLGTLGFSWGKQKGMDARKMEHATKAHKALLAHLKSFFTSLLIEILLHAKLR